MYDIVIIGSGPAGLTAAIYALRANKTVIVIEKGGFGGQMTFSPKIENYPGKITISGNELADKFVEQAISLGCVFESGEVVKIKLNSDTKTVVTDDNSFDCKSVIIAAGAKHRQLGVANENHFAGNGISYCAVCDGAFFEGKTVAIVGGGNSALQEAVLLSEICKEVIIIQNLPFLTGEKKLCDSLAQKSNVSYLYEKTVTGFLGTDELCGVALKDESTGEILQLSIDGLFVAI
ncbi:MAG: FAD-dependent oxidoreductase, partial [Clostridia bacterium]